jgi:hypothetical protein
MRCPWASDVGIVRRRGPRIEPRMTTEVTVWR